MTAILRVLILLALATMANAQDQLAELERNRALWESHSFTHYSLVVSKSCFCQLPSEARIIVAGPLQD